MSATAVACDHGMPTPASCIDCMAEVGLGPSTVPELDDPYIGSQQAHDDAYYLTGHRRGMAQ